MPRCRLVLAWLSAASLAPIFPSSQVTSQVLPFHTYTTKEGLISNTITSLTQDSRGYIWIGTYEGLSVYDGSTFRNYTTSDGLAHSVVWTIIESKRSPGTMFIGTNGGGISQFRNGRFTSRRLGTDRGRNQVADLLEDTLGNLWCMTSSGMVISAGDSLLSLPDGVDSMPTSNIVQTHDGIIWFGSGERVLGYNAGRQHVSTIDVSHGRKASVQGLSVDDEGDLWVVAGDSTIRCYRRQALVTQRRMMDGAPGWVRVSHDGMVWIQLNHEGVARIPKSRFAEGAFEYLTEANGLHDINIWTMLCDNEDDVWLAGFSRGLAKLSEHAICRFSLQSGSPSNAPYRGGGLDSSGRYWTATEDRIVEIWSEGTAWHQEFHVLAGTVLINSITLEKEHDRLWVCGRDGVITCCSIHHRPAHSSVLTSDQCLTKGIDLPSGPLVGCAVFEGRYLWCIIDPDVVVIDLFLKSTTVLRHGVELPLAGARALFRDSRGDVWIGGYDGGLARLPHGDPTGPVKLYTTADGLPDNGIRCIAECRDGTLWFGTRYGGLARYDGQAFQSVTLQDGLVSNAIWDLCEDQDRRLWIATSLGLMYMESGTRRPLPWNNELLGVAVSSCHVDTARRVWSVTAEGIMMLEAERPILHRQPPPVYVTQVLVNGRSVPFAAGLALSHDENTVALQYVGLSFKHEKANRYRFRLQGTPGDWSAPTADRSVTYGSLGPGHYVFEVTAFNADGVVSVTPATVAFTIYPPFWQQWWFMVLCALGAAGVAYIVYRYRIEKLLQVERLRTRIASDLHDDIGSGLTRIAILSDMAARQTGVAGDSPMEKAGSLARELHDVMADVVWSINPTHESSGDLVRRLRVFATEMCEGAGIHLEFSVDDRIEGLELSPEVRRSVLLIVKEAVTNSCRHASCSRLAIQLHSRENALVLSLVDNGSGFNPGRLARMSGLTNMKRRAEKAGGTLTIVSSPGAGTRIDASIPFE
jgi:ligand-binding sensor domain-containing protein